MQEEMLHLSCFKMKKIILFLIVLSALFISGCSEEFGIVNNSEEELKDTLFVIGYNFEGTNPLLVKNDTNREIFSLIYDPLYSIDLNCKPYGKLAEGTFMVTDDGLNYRIDLKKNVTFHDGTYLTSTDVCATINYLIKNSTSFDYNVRNILNVSVNTEHSVNVTLKEPVPYLEALLTFPIVNSKDILKEFSFNGTGMYKVSSYVDKKYIDLEVFPNYYNEKNENIRKIKVQLMPDKQTSDYAYASGMSDVFSQDIFTDTENANPKSGVKAKEFLSMNYNFLLLNHDNPVFKNLNVRKAINMAIDRESIVTDVLFSHGEAVYTPFFKDAWCYNQNIKPVFSVDEAKKILILEGFVPDVNTGILKKEDGTLLSFNILVNNDNNFRIQVANKISENLKYIGIDCKVKIVSFEEYQNAYYSKTYEAFLGTVPMSYDFSMSLFLGDYNISNYYNASVLETLNSLCLLKGAEEKQGKYVEIQKIFYYDIPHISLYYTKETLQFSNKIKSGLNPNSFNIFNNMENWEF